MRYQKLRQARKILKQTDGLFWRNVVLSSGFALPFVVVACVSLKNAAALSIAMLFALVPPALILSFIPAKLPGWLRPVLGCLLSMVSVLLSYFPIQFISLEIFDSLGIFLPLTAVSSLVFGITAEPYAGKWADAILDGLRAAVGFALAAALVGGLRELLGSGTLWGTPVWSVKVPGLVPVFGGFIITAFFAAGSRLLRRLSSVALIRSNNPLPGLEKAEGGARR